MFYERYLTLITARSLSNDVRCLLGRTTNLLMKTSYVLESPTLLKALILHKRKNEISRVDQDGVVVEKLPAFDIIWESVYFLCLKECELCQRKF